jgi:hypothetical protein
MKRKFPTSTNSSVSSLPFYPPSVPRLSSNKQQNKKNSSSSSTTRNLTERERESFNKENQTTSNRHQDYQMIDNLFSHVQSTITSELIQNDSSYQEKRQKLLENSQFSFSNYQEYLSNLQKKEIPSLIEWKERKQTHLSSSITEMATELDKEMMMKLTKKNDVSHEITVFSQNQLTLLQGKVNKTVIIIVFTSFLTCFIFFSCFLLSFFLLLCTVRKA